MATKISRNAKYIFLSMNLLCYALTATASGGGSGGVSNPAQAPAGQPPATCPRDALKLGVCANLLGGLLGVEIGNPPTTPCCTLLTGLADLEAAVCLCTAIRANVLGINLNVPLSLALLLNACGKSPPAGFVCA